MKTDETGWISNPEELIIIESLKEKLKIPEPFLYFGILIKYTSFIDRLDIHTNYPELIEIALELDRLSNASELHKIQIQNGNYPAGDIKNKLLLNLIKQTLHKNPIFSPVPERGTDRSSRLKHQIAKKRRFEALIIALYGEGNDDLVNRFTRLYAWFFNADTIKNNGLLNNGIKGIGTIFLLNLNFVLKRQTELNPNQRYKTIRIIIETLNLSKYFKDPQGLLIDIDAIKKRVQYYKDYNHF